MSKRGKTEDASEATTKPETTTELIDAIIAKEGIKVEQVSWDDYFPSSFESIRSHFLRQGKFKEYIRFVVDLGLLARKSDNDFFTAVKSGQDKVKVRYGESCLCHLYRRATDPQKDKEFKPTKYETEVLEGFGERSTSQPIREFDDCSLEFTTRILRLNPKYRVCMVPNSDFVHTLSIYPFLTELIYAVAEDIDADEELFEAMVYDYTSAMISHHEVGNFDSFWSLKETVLKHLKQKDVKLVFALGVLDTYRYKVECFSKELTMDDLPGFIEEMEESTDVIVIDRNDDNF